MRPAVSIIVPVHNAGATLAECLASVERQTLRSIEVICVDDASGDDSLALARSFAEADDRFKVISLPENAGVSAARNRALDCAQGDYVLFMDADDWYPSDDAVGRLHRAARGSGAQVAAGEMVVVDPATGQARSDFRGAGHLSLYNFEREGMVEYRDWQGDLGFQRFIFSRGFVEREGLRFPPVTHYEDPVFLVKALVAAGRFYAVPAPVYCYRSGTMPTEPSEKAIEDAVESIVDLLVVAQQNDLQVLKGYLIESLEWYLAQNVYRSATYRLGDALVSPVRRVRQRVLGR